MFFQNFILNYFLLVIVFISNEIIVKAQSQNYRRYNQYYQQQPYLKRSADSCITSLRTPGTCTQLKSCPEALYYLRYYHLQPFICNASSRFNPTVCCGKSASQPNTVGARITQPQESQRKSGQRISEKKCFESHLANYGRALTPTIVGGTKTRIGEFSYMAAVGWPRGYGSGYDFKCGGVLITKRFVITAAHCGKLGGSAPSIVEIGGYSLNTGQNSLIKISSVFVHPEYDDRYHYNDIGLLKLTDYAPQIPACLWQTQNINSPVSAIAIGYGTNAFAGKYSKDLLKINVRTYSHQECKSYFPPNHIIPYGISSGHICAGYPSKGKDTCQGDSGGPLLSIGTAQNQKIPFVIGITSFGKNCAGSAPGVYTKIANYLSWIESIAWSR